LLFEADEAELLSGVLEVAGAAAASEAVAGWLWLAAAFALLSLAGAADEALELLQVSATDFTLVTL